jgi:hypothetical protein
MPARLRQTNSMSRCDIKPRTTHPVYGHHHAMLTEIIPTPVEFSNSKAKENSERASASRTCLPGGITSLPMPSPGIVAIPYVFISVVLISPANSTRSLLPVRDRPPAASVTEVLVEECGDLVERLSVLRHAIVELVLSMRLAFVDLKLCVNAGLAQLPVYAHRVA